MYHDTFLSFWWSEVEILQQRDEKEKEFLKSELFTKTRTFTCNVTRRHVMDEPSASFNISYETNGIVMQYEGN